MQNLQAFWPVTQSNLFWNPIFKIHLIYSQMSDLPIFSVLTTKDACINLIGFYPLNSQPPNEGDSRRIRTRIP